MPLIIPSILNQMSQEEPGDSLASDGSLVYIRNFYECLETIIHFVP